MGEARQEVAISLDGLARHPCVDANVSRTPRSIQPLAVALCWPSINRALCYRYFVCRPLTISLSTAGTHLVKRSQCNVAERTACQPPTSLGLDVYSRPTAITQAFLHCLTVRLLRALFGEADACLKVPPTTWMPLLPCRLSDFLSSQRLSAIRLEVSTYHSAIHHACRTIKPSR